ncbi:transposon Tf2-9 polyprotein, partial [Trichonephila clavipes]
MKIITVNHYEDFSSDFPVSQDILPPLTEKDFNLFRRYIKNFAKPALPLTNLLRKDTPFEWTSETQEAFDDIKKAILNPPVLALPDPHAELQITTDASSRGIGALLEQKYPNSEDVDSRSSPGVREPGVRNRDYRNVGASRFNEPNGRQGCVLAQTVESNQGGRFDSNESVADSFPSGAVGFKSSCMTILGAFSLLLPEKTSVVMRIALR